jgi:hypothetical protein
VAAPKAKQWEQDAVQYELGLASFFKEQPPSIRSSGVVHRVTAALLKWAVFLRRGLVEWNRAAELSTDFLFPFFLCLLSSCFFASL